MAIGSSLQNRGASDFEDCQYRRLGELVFFAEGAHFETTSRILLNFQLPVKRHGLLLRRRYVR